MQTETAKKSSTTRKKTPMPTLDYKVLNQLTDHAFYLALKMIDVANHERPTPPKGEPKVGGHPAACGSSKHILAAIHLVCRKSEDYMANKPHVSPMDHAFNFLLKNFRDSQENPMPLEDCKTAMHNLRHYSRTGEPVFQSYHAEADPDSFRFFPSGSVGIPPVSALYTALGYEFAKDHGFDLKEDPHFWCLMGDSEFREGSLMEAMPDAGERQLGRLIWIVDYNRQNLDGVRVSNETALRGTDADRIAKIAEANGWDAVVLEHGETRKKMFAAEGGKIFRWALEEGLSEFEFQALLGSSDAKVIREALNKKDPELQAFLKRYSDEEVYEAFYNVGGHDLETLVTAFEKAKQDTTRPTLIVAYTVKGHGLECQARSGNHSTLPDTEEINKYGKKIGANLEDPFSLPDPNSPAGKFLEKRHNELVPRIRKLLEASQKRREEYHQLARSFDWPTDFDITALKFAPHGNTQWMWGQVAAKLDRLGRGLGDNPEKLSEVEEKWQKFAQFFFTMAPDVGSSTNTSPNMSGKLYGEIGQQDFENVYHVKDKKAPDVVPHTAANTGHIRFEIAEGNCMTAAGAIGKFKHFVGIPFFPVMTIYDFFIKRCHDQFYYNLYWGSHFGTMGTPCGVTLAPEGAQHSWKSDFQIPHCVTWEPFYALEVDWILADTLRRHFCGEDKDRESALIRCVTKGTEQKQFIKRLKAQPKYSGLSDDAIFEKTRQQVLEGGYCLIDHREHSDYKPGDNVIHLFAMGALVEEAIKASDILLEKGILANVFVVTSPDLLLGNFAYYNNYEHLTKTLGVTGDLYVNPADRNIEKDSQWYSVQASRIPIVSVHDGEPGLLDNIGSVVGVKHRSLAIRKTSKSGTTEDVYYYHGINGPHIAEAAEQVLTDTAHETFKVSPDLNL